MLDGSQISQFFQNQTVFLTGGSGFVGKVLIEKLLRECQEIRRIYVLMRSKKNKSPEERFAELFDYPIFENLKAQNENVFGKVTLVIGDCLQPCLGLSEDDKKLLIEETTCVIHAAANVKFEQTLKEATFNVRATKDLIELAKKMTNLKVFTYISTAYSNCIYSHIKEEFYEPPMKADELLTIVNALDEEILQEITPHLLGKWPNTYVYTKSISEDLIKTSSNDLPVVVVRPAIICSSVSEPVPGWIDNFYGVVGIVAGAALGLLRSMYIKVDARAALAPVDYVANCILAATWNKANDGTNTIYNFVGHKDSKLTWLKFMNTIEPACWAAASEKVVWYYCFKLRENRIWHKICIFFLHTVVSYIADFVFFCVGQPRIAVAGYKRLNRMLDLVSYFSTRNWDFDSAHVEDLWRDMNDEDKKRYNFNMESMDWESYAYNSTFGARRFLLKDPIDTLPRGKRKLKILFVAHYTVLALFWYLMYKFITFMLSFIF